jgi:hypothetical protein
MSYLAPDFEFDVFVSYSHGDPRGAGDSPLKRWTHRLIQNLETEIIAVDPEFRDLQIWHDKQIDPTAHLTDELRSKVKSAGILLIIMSRHYLLSSWCQDEREWFLGQVRDRSRDPGRIFVVRSQPTNESNWPEFLRDERGHAMIGFRFHDPNEETPYGWWGEATEEYGKHLNTLRTGLTKRLRELRQKAQAQAQAAQAQAAQAQAAQAQALIMAPSGAPSSRAAPSTPGAPLIRDGRRIFVHARTEDRPVRDQIQRVLTQDGLRPLSLEASANNALADWARESKIRVETAKRCNALALVRGDDNQSFVGDVLDIGVDERERIQTERGAPLPCAVLDHSGDSMPIDVTNFGIERFDLSQENWHSQFMQWLNDSGLAASTPAS